MTRHLGGTVAVVLLAGIGVALVSAAPAPITTVDVIKDRASFIPHRKYEPMKGKVVGLLVSDVAAKMGHEGRSGPQDAMGFSVNGNSYRWVYVPVEKNPLITRLNVHVGEKGDRIKVYPQLSMANAQTVQQWKIDVPYALVEVEVNDGDGAPAEEGFVATNMTRLDGTPAYPFKITEVLADIKKRHATWESEQAKKIDAAMSDAANKVLKQGDKVTGPREKSELFYITWLPDRERLRIHFRTTLTDGAYKYGGGAEIDDPRLPPIRPIKPLGPALPVKPGALVKPLPIKPAIRVKPAVQPQPAVPAQKGGLAAFPPPPPRDFPKVRYGTQFGIEYGIAYEVTKNGKIDRTLILPIESFSKELPPPPAIGPRGGPRGVDPVPPLPKPAVKKD